MLPDRRCSRPQPSAAPRPTGAAPCGTPRRPDPETPKALREAPPATPPPCRRVKLTLATHQATRKRSPVHADGRRATGRCGTRPSPHPFQKLGNSRRRLRIERSRQFPPQTFPLLQTAPLDALLDALSPALLNQPSSDLLTVRLYQSRHLAISLIVLKCCQIVAAPSPSLQQRQGPQAQRPAELRVARSQKLRKPSAKRRPQRRRRAGA